jgi:NADPH:quinone reductase-like Zn-dependent oxidoreductase
MKAIRLHERGGADKLVWEEAPIPRIRPGDAMVKVLASGITRNELNWGPTYTDENGRSRLPTIPGHELCGIVTAVTSGVIEVAPGDVVYGLTSFYRDGTAAEFIATKASDLAPKPRTLETYQAAAVPLSALTAWQALFDHAGIASGQRVLIHGAAGGVGSFAIQLAVWRGAEVIAATSADNINLVRDLGAHEVVDYGAGPFEDHLKGIDVVLDTIGRDIQDRSWGILKPGGILVTTAGGINIPIDVKDKGGVFFIVKPEKQELIEIGKLIDQQIVRPVIAGVIPIDRAREAFEKVDGHGNKGKIVLKL